MPTREATSWKNERHLPPPPPPLQRSGKICERSGSLKCAASLAVRRLAIYQNDTLMWLAGHLLNLHTAILGNPEQLRLCLGDAPLNKALLDASLDGRVGASEA